MTAAGTAVLAGGWLVPVDGGSKQLPAAWSWADVLAAAVELDVVTVYVVGELHDQLRAGDGVLIEFTGGADEDEGGDDAGGVWRLRVRTEVDGFACGGRGGGVRLGSSVSVVLLDRDEAGLSGPWRGCTPAELRRALWTFQQAVGVPWADSIGRTAERLILSMHPRGRGGTLLDRDAVIPEPAAGGSLELPWASWRRELTSDEQRGGWVHAFDANAQYLGAWVGAELGHGEPRHETRPHFDPTRAGLWRIEGVDTLPNLRPLLPGPAIARRDWYTTPTVTRLLEVVDGLSVPRIEEAWIWPRRSRFLRAAGERLREARAGAMRTLDDTRIALAAADAGDGSDVGEWLSRRVVAGEVLAAVKSLYRVETGRFNYAGRDPHSGWARPDWGHTVRAHARVNLHRRLWKLGAAPFAIATDGLVFVDDEADGEKFAQRIGLPLGRGLGQYRHDASVPAAAVREEIETAKPGALFRAIGAVPNG